VSGTRGRRFGLTEIQETASWECDEYQQFTDGKLHFYIPLLAVHPSRRGQGHGRAIVEHLVDEAANYFPAELNAFFHDAIFLDVYEESTGAVTLYRKCGFATLGPGPLVDPANGKNFYVMARRFTP